MAYSDVEWTNGDVITEVKLDQMCENEDLAYHAAEAVQIYTCEELTSGSVGTIATPQWGLYIDGTQVGADMATNDEPNVLADLGTLSSLCISEGIHEVEIRWVSTNVGGGVYKFFVSSAHNYLTIWADLSRTGSAPIGPYTHYAKNITVIMHITQKTWT